MAGAQQGVAQPSRLFSVVGLVALRQAAPRSAAQRTQTTSVPPAGRGRVRRSATNATTLNTYGLISRDPLRNPESNGPLSLNPSPLGGERGASRRTNVLRECESGKRHAIS